MPSAPAAGSAFSLSHVLATSTVSSQLNQMTLLTCLTCLRVAHPVSRGHPLTARPRCFTPHRRRHRTYDTHVRVVPRTHTHQRGPRLNTKTALTHTMAPSNQTTPQRAQRSAPSDGVTCVQRRPCMSLRIFCVHGRRMHVLIVGASVSVHTRRMVAAALKGSLRCAKPCPSWIGGVHRTPPSCARPTVVPSVQQEEGKLLLRGTVQCRHGLSCFEAKDTHFATLPGACQLGEVFYFDTPKTKRKHVEVGEGGDSYFDAHGGIIVGADGKMVRQRGTAERMSLSDGSVYVHTLCALCLGLRICITANFPPPVGRAVCVSANACLRMCWVMRAASVCLFAAFLRLQRGWVCAGCVRIESFTRSMLIDCCGNGCRWRTMANVWLMVLTQATRTEGAETFAVCKAGEHVLAGQVICVTTWHDVEYVKGKHGFDNHITSARAPGQEVAALGRAQCATDPSGKLILKGSVQCFCAGGSCEAKCWQNKQTHFATLPQACRPAAYMMMDTLRGSSTSQASVTPATPHTTTTTTIMMPPTSSPPATCMPRPSHVPPNGDGTQSEAQVLWPCA